MSDTALYAILGGGFVLAYLLIVFVADRSHTRRLEEAARKQSELLERYR